MYVALNVYFNKFCFYKRVKCMNTLVTYVTSDNFAEIWFIFEVSYTNLMLS